MKFHLREKLAVESVQHLRNGYSKFVLKLFLGIVFRRIGIQRKPIRHHSVWETAEEVPSSRETVGDGASSVCPAQPPSNSMAAQRSTAKTLFLVFIFFPSFQKRKIDYNTTMPAKFMPDSKACWAA